MASRSAAQLLRDLFSIEDMLVFGRVHEYGTPRNLAVSVMLNSDARTAKGIVVRLDREPNESYECTLCFDLAEGDTERSVMRRSVDWLLRERGYPLSVNGRMMRIPADFEAFFPKPRS